MTMGRNGTEWGKLENWRIAEMKILLAGGAGYIGSHTEPI